jgi:riboflavin kinase/FMN adenylyltransferase
MNIAYSLDERLTEVPTLLTIGKFDGFHLGHQLLIRTAVERAQQCRCGSAVLTFDPHPGMVVHPERKMRLLTSVQERIELIGRFDPDLLIVAPFNRQVMQMSAYDYMRKICDALPLRELWMGANFALGRNREGDVQRLMEIGEELGYGVGSVAPMLVEGAPVSSSRVRQLLRDGIVEGIEVLLGRPFKLQGTVVEGDHRGRQIGFPTANIQLDDPLHAVPANGVYVCRAFVEQQAFPAVVNIGIRPTFDGKTPTVEAHLLNWDGDLYGWRLTLHFLHRLRGEVRFGSVDELVAQIERDVQRARELL